jgi:PPP family 3-phenylpropionic acid transporter
MARRGTAHDERRSGPSPHFAYSLRLGAFYGALFLIYGVHLPYLPVWLDARGLSAQEIAIITAAPYFLRAFITPTTAMLADRMNAHRTLINVLAWVSLVLALLLVRAESFWTILVCAVPFAIALSTIVPLTETIAVAGVRAHGLDYGRMRLWGSITFVAAGFAGGWLIDETGAAAVLGCILAGAAATAVFAWLLPERAAYSPRLSGEAAGAELARDGLESLPPTQPRGGAKPGLDQARELVRSPLFLAFLLAAGAAQGAHGMFYAFGALAWQTQGITTAWIGTLWAIAIVGEVALFAYSGRVVRRWGPPVLLVAATAAAVLRWGIMAIEPPLWLLIPLQTLHTLTYGASHLGAMHFISRAVPDGAQGTAQALYATVASGVLMGVATLVAGWLYARFGAHAYVAMAVLSALGLAGALYVIARWDGGLILQDAKT